MTKTKIYKTILKSDDSIIELPEGAVILSAGVEHFTDQISIWYSFNSVNEYSVEKTHIYCVNTGHSFDKGTLDKFIGTVKTSNGIVWHVYEAIA